MVVPQRRGAWLRAGAVGARCRAASCCSRVHVQPRGPLFGSQEVLKYRCCSRRLSARLAYQTSPSLPLFPRMPGCPQTPPRCALVLLPWHCPGMSAAGWGAYDGRMHASFQLQQGGSSTAVRHRHQSRHAPCLAAYFVRPGSHAVPCSPPLPSPCVDWLQQVPLALQSVLPAPEPAPWHASEHATLGTMPRRRRFLASCM